jgi:hypothetical protein
MIVKVFLGPKNHGFVSVDGEDAKRIAGKIKNLITLEEMKSSDQEEMRVKYLGLSRRWRLRGIT